MSSSYITDQSPAGDFESITVSTTAIGPTAAKLKINQTGGMFKRAVKVFLTTETNSIRLRWDGTDPTASVGHLLTAGSSITVEGEQNVANLKMIRSVADGTVMLTYYYNL
jgi:hypothetical protein